MGRADEGDDRAVIYVDPDTAADPAVAAIERAGYRVTHVASAADARERLRDSAVDCLVTRHRLADETGLALLSWVRERAPDLPVILFTDDGDEELASDAIAAGVTEYVPSRTGERLHRSLVDCVDRSFEGTEPDVRAVDERLKDRAMDEAPVGITIADAQRPDTPMVYINDSFEEMTGYAREKVLGWNCRFLQGGDTDPETVDRIREAIDAGEEVSVELINYDADGEPFWNRLDIAPIHQDGELTHFVGFQADVTDRVEAERTAKREAERAQRERETVESLLADLDGLVADVTGTLVEARSRAAAESSVCDRLAATDRYPLACVADVAPGSADLAVTTRAGDDGALAGETFPLDGPVGRAMESGDPVFADPPAGGWETLEGALADAPLGAIPLRYGDSTFGVLVVVAADGFDERERGILSAIGRATATALNAIATQRRLHSDEVIELEFALAGPDPFVVALSATLECSFELVGTVTGRTAETSLFFEVTDATVEDLEAALAERDAAGAIEVRPLTSGEGRTVVEFAVEATPLLETLREQGGHLQELVAESGSGRLVVDSDPEADTRRLVEAIEAAVDGADLTAHRQRERPARTRGDVLAEIEDRLTDRQATALRKAYVGGFFEWPRDTTGQDLAASMDIDRSTFHQHFRAAQRKVLETLYDPS